MPVSRHRFGTPSPTRSTVLPAWFSRDDRIPACQSRCRFLLRHVIDVLLRSLRSLPEQQSCSEQLPALHQSAAMLGGKRPKPRRAFTAELFDDADAWRTSDMEAYRQKAGTP